jgi:hypothetical protein
MTCKPRIIVMSYARTKLLKIYICKDKRGWYYTYSFWSAVNFYLNPGDYTTNLILPYEIAKRLAYSCIDRMVSSTK